MNKFGKNIKLFLMDGTANGRWICELSNWTGKAYKIPRNYLKSCESRVELHSSGIYFLFGIDELEEKPLVYIGESEDILIRLKNHLEEKDYWNEVVLFMSKDDYLNKAHIKYLENRFYSMAHEAGRNKVMNMCIPTKSAISESEEAELEEYIFNAKIILNTLGHKAFEAIDADKESMEANQLFYFQRKIGDSGKGTGIPTSEGFVVYKGSLLNHRVSLKASQWIKTLRNKYKDKIKDDLTTEDILFSSPSAASSFLCGNSSNGRMEWKTELAVPLKKWEELLIES